LIPDNCTGSGSAEAVATTAGNWICKDCSHLNPLKSKFCEPSPQVKADRTLVPRVGASVPTSRQLQINITIVNLPSYENCLFASCIFKLEDFHTHNLMLGMTMTMKDGLTWISSLLCPFNYPYQLM